jgi:hypothetical protein
MQGVLMQSVRASVAIGADVAAAEAPHVLAAKASDVTSTAEASGVGRACQQARSEKGCCQYRDHPFHRETPFQSDCSAP